MSFHQSDIEEDGNTLSTPSFNVSDCGSINHQIGINRGNDSVFTSGVRPPPEDIGPSSYDPYSEYKSEGRRLETFYDWPSDSVVSKEDLAQNGFIYLHSHDRTRCIFCRAVFRDWEHGDNVSQEHRKFSPECPFIAGYSIGNQPLPRSVEQVVHRASNDSVNIYGGKVTLTNHGMFVSAGSVVTSQGLTEASPVQFNTADAKRYTGTPAVSTECQSSNNRIISRAKYTNWESRNDRLRSFATWPPNTRPTPAQLVDAGLLYMGNGSEDRCKCFYCGGELYDWEPNDDPMEEHAKWFPDCGYVLQIKGREYVQYVKDKQLGLEDAPPATHFFARPHILQVLHEGFTKEEIQSLINKYGAEKLVEARSIIQALEYERSQRPRSVFHPESEDVHMAEQEQETRVKVQPGQNGLGFVDAPPVTKKNARPHIPQDVPEDPIEAQGIQSCEHETIPSLSRKQERKRKHHFEKRAIFIRISRESDEDELEGRTENNANICQETGTPARNYMNAMMRQNGSVSE